MLISSFLARLDVDILLFILLKSKKWGIMEAGEGHSSYRLSLCNHFSIDCKRLQRRTELTGLFLVVVFAVEGGLSTANELQKSLNKKMTGLLFGKKDVAVLMGWP